MAVSCRVTVYTKILTRSFSIITDWLSGFFHYCRVRNANRAIAGQVFEWACQLLVVEINRAMHAPESDDLHRAVVALLMACHWADHYRPENIEHWIKALQESYSLGTLPAKSHAKIAVSFATNLGNRTETLPTAWAKLALESHWPVLDLHDKLQVLCSATTTMAAAKERRQQMAEVIHELRKHAHDDTTPSELKQAYHIDRLFNYLDPIINLAATSGEADYLYRLLCDWYGVSSSKVRDSPPLFVLSTGNKSILYLGHAGVLQIRADDMPTIEEMTTVANMALGTLVTVQNSSHLFENAPARPGLPNAEIAKEFADTAEKYYGTYNHPEVADLIRGESSMIILPGTQHPVQPIIYKSFGFTLPIAVSLEKPLNERPIKQVLIWAPNQTISEEIEIAAVSEVLSKSGISVKIQSGEQARNRERFIDAYKDPENDVFWVISHGEYDHWKPHEVKLMLSYDGEASVSFLDLSAIPLDSSHGRRLLILNICDGATAASLGGINRLGFSQALACDAQAVISHIWPVQSIHAAIFGACLAIGLSQETGHFEGYERTLSILFGGETLLRKLEEIGHGGVQLAERARSQGYNPNSVFSWGSPLFLE